MSPIFQIALISIVTFSLFGCGDNTKKEPIIRSKKNTPAATSNSTKPTRDGAEDTQVEILQATGEVLLSEEVKNDEGVVTPAAYHLVVKIPNYIKNVLEEYSLSINAEDLTKTDEGGSELLTTLKDGEEAPLTRVQILDQEAKVLILTQYEDESLKSGRAYLFTVEENKDLKARGEALIDDEFSHVALVNKIRERAVEDETSIDEAISSLVKESIKTPALEVSTEDNK